jgi:hypothetical protein
MPNLPLPDGSGRVELREDDDGHITMIVCRELDGSLRWQASPPGGERDSWVSVEVLSDRVVGSSWSCWRISIESATGTEVERDFTK